ncbi:MAG: TetR/AcrR family transcriptional regulator [Actinomycetota bacterium]|nr:TetR/AcrR family transcriptional regulator [Actinomycetota bacterium]
MATDTSAPPSPLRRADRRRAKRIDEILQVATRLLSERGYLATNLDDIADELDLSKASLYHYFPSKEHLILSCLERIGSETHKHLAVAADSSLSPRLRLHAAIRAQVLVLTRDESAGASLFLQDLGLPPAAREHLRALVDEHDRLFRSIIDDGIRSGELHVSDPRVARLLMHGAVNFIPSWYQGSPRMSPEHLADIVADTLLQLFGATKI